MEVSHDIGNPPVPPPELETDTGDTLKKKRKYSKGMAWHARQKKLENLNNTLREFIIWGETYCSIQNTPRRQCGHCWHELKEKAGL